MSVPPSEQHNTTASEVEFDFREAMGRLASGVVMVTTIVDGIPWGMTVSACCSVSMNPQLLLVSLATQTKSASVIQEHKYFGVSILGANSIEVARFGSAPAQPKFIPQFCGVNEGPLNLSPAVRGSLAHLDCALESTIIVGDHILLIGKVHSVRSIIKDPAMDSPLLYFRREYFSLGRLQDALLRN